MSSVDNYLLKVSCSAAADRLVAGLNQRLQADTEEDRNVFVKVSDTAGGTRAMECDIYLLAGNYFPGGLIAHHLAVLCVAETRGSHLTIPNSIQLFCQPDSDPGNRGMVLVWSNT